MFRALTAISLLCLFGAIWMWATVSRIGRHHGGSVNILSNYWNYDCGFEPGRLQLGLWHYDPQVLAVGPPYDDPSGNISLAAIAWRNKFSPSVYQRFGFAVGRVPTFGRHGEFIEWDGNTRLLEIPYWALIFLFAIIPVFHVSRQRQWRRLDRLKRGECPQCGYDLRATPHRCPECGSIPAPIP